jgi:hypothetical protein
LFDACDAELLAGPVAVPLAGDYSSRNEQETGSLFQADGGSVGGCVGKESQGQASRIQLGDPIAVAEKSGGVSGVGVAKRAKLLVIASDESGAGADAARDLDEAAVDAKAEFGHGLRLVDVGAREKLGTRGAKGILRDGKDAAIVPVKSGEIEQTKQNALRAYTD